jgi:hypothetical protein
MVMESEDGYGERRRIWIVKKVIEREDRYGERRRI